jgi:hypothetical protein
MQESGRRGRVTQSSRPVTKTVSKGFKKLTSKYQHVISYVVGLGEGDCEIDVVIADEICRSWWRKPVGS